MDYLLRGIYYGLFTTWYLLKAFTMEYLLEVFTWGINRGIY